VTGIGHNRGPSLAAGQSWRAHCWRQARTALLPVLPLEVVRLRVRRAKEIGLDYRTYAGIRATTGHDLVAFLFSTNALHVFRDGQMLDDARRDRLNANRNIGQMIAALPPVDAGWLQATLAQQGVAVSAAPAPTLRNGWSETRAIILDLLRSAGCPSDRVLLIGETMLERDWSGAARMAGFLSGERYFGGTAAG
jgi:hypothetical protein